MKLTHHHRAQLISTLQECLEKTLVLKQRLESESAKEDISFADSIQVDICLNNIQIEAIKNILTYNEMDY